MATLRRTRSAVQTRHSAPRVRPRHLVRGVGFGVVAGVALTLLGWAGVMGTLRRSPDFDPSEAFGPGELGLLVLAGAVAGALAGPSFARGIARRASLRERLRGKDGRP